MAMEWQVNSSAQKSSVSEKPFEPGDVMHSYLVRNAEGELVRIDLHDDERADWQAESPVIGRWSSIVPEKEDAAAEAKKQQLRTTEGIFLSLFPDADDDEDDADTEDEAEAENAEAAEEDDPELQADRDTLKYLLALMLERKRVLKAVGRAKPGEPQTYRCPKLDREFVVPSIDITGEAVLRIQEQLQVIVG